MCEAPMSFWPTLRLEVWTEFNRTWWTEKPLLLWKYGINNSFDCPGLLDEITYKVFIVDLIVTPLGPLMGNHVLISQTLALPFMRVSWSQLLMVTYWIIVFVNKVLAVYLPIPDGQTCISYIRPQSPFIFPLSCARVSSKNVWYTNMKWTRKSSRP